MSDPIVDAVAVALRHARRGSTGPGFDGLTVGAIALYRAEASAAIHAYQDALAANGWVLIPPPSGRINEHDRKITTREQL